MKNDRAREKPPKTELKKIGDMPRYKQAANYVLWGLVALAVIIYAVRYRAHTLEDEQTQAQNSLAAATNYLERLRDSADLRGGSEMDIANVRKNSYQIGNNLADTAMTAAGSGNPQIIAASLICKGDLNFEMANLPLLPGAETQPSLQPDQPQAKYLDQAAENYNQVLKEYPDDLAQITAAHFGLAAVAEDRASIDQTQWDVAAKNYQAVIDSSASQTFKGLASDKLATLKDLQKPLAQNVMPMVAPTSAPSPMLIPDLSTQPSGVRPATEPTTRE